MTTAINCPPCRTLECEIVSDQDSYTLNGGTLFLNPPTPITIPVPPGTYTLPAGTIQFVLSPNPVSPLRLLGCQCEIVRDIDGLTTEQIAVVAQEMVNEAAVQQAQCNSNLTGEFENCPPCRTLQCQRADDVDFYTLNNGTLYENPETPVPIDQPPFVFIVPRGTIQFVVSSDPVSPLRLLGCLCEIVVDITGKTPAEIAVIAQDMVNAAATQFGQCRNLKPPSPFFNGVEIVTCPNGNLINLVGNPPLPTGVSLIDGQLVILPGIVFSDISLEDANNKAIALLQSTLANLMAQGKANCGFWNTAQTFCCPDVGTPCTTVPAFTIFSQISQADADAQALALAISETSCGTINVCTDGFGGVQDNVYAIQGYDRTQFATLPGFDCGPEWDGTFSAFFSGQWFGTSGSFIGCVTINGAGYCITQLGVDCILDVPNWTLAIGDFWVGTKVGGDPAGLYTRSSGNSPGPATVTLVKIPGTTVKTSENCSS